MIFIAFKYFHSLKDEHLEDKFGSIYEGLNTKSKSALIYNVIFVMRRIHLAVLALFIIDDEYSIFQVMNLIFQSLFMLIYLCLVRPFEDNLANNLEIFNEIFVLIASYHLLLFTDHIDDPDLQYIVGWSIIGFVVINFTANIVVMMVLNIIELKNTLPKVFKKYKLLLHKICHKIKGT